MSIAHTSRSVHPDFLVHLLDACRLLAVYLDSIASKEEWIVFGQFGRVRHTAARCHPCISRMNISGSDAMSMCRVHVMNDWKDFGGLFICSD
jgi:hypothetical protein